MQRRYNNRNRRGNSSSSSGRNSLLQKYWPFVMAILLLFTCFFIVKAACASSHSLDGDPTHPDAQAAAASNADSSSLNNKEDKTPHYADLHLAKYNDPKRGKDCIQKDYEGFTVMFNPENHTSDWVGWELLRSETEGSESRSDNFRQDSEVKGCPTTDDYRKSGFDRGHLCPAADQKWSAQAMQDCFMMTNMTPQAHALNAGAWQTLEQKERLWAKRDSAIVIVAGPIYAAGDTQTIGANKVRVPSAFYKVLLAPYAEQPRAIGFVYPNMTAPGNMENYAMTVDEIEELTGLDFFYNLPDDIENQVESRKSFTEWNR